MKRNYYYSVVSILMDSIYSFDYHSGNVFSFWNNDDYNLRGHILKTNEIEIICAHIFDIRS